MGDHHPGGDVNVLALCAGIGGIELGLKLVCPSARTICYVEGEAYAATTLVARAEEGFLDPAPIWSDVRTFDGKPWRGVVDLVTAGFPCQPFSAAGKRLREDDPRHLWPDIFRIIRDVEPSLVFLENVQTRAYLEPLRDLRGMGFEVSDPFACTAAELGAGHFRRRVFVLALNSSRLSRRTRIGKTTPDVEAVVSKPASEQVGTGGLPRSDGQRIEWWGSEPSLERVVHGVPNRVDRDRALGNAVVPAVAAFAFSSLLKEMCDPSRAVQGLPHTS
ncbi:MAG: DNA cytosine methyltransferase [Nitrospiraceae bacterium]